MESPYEIMCQCFCTCETGTFWRAGEWSDDQNREDFVYTCSERSNSKWHFEHQKLTWSIWNLDQYLRLLMEHLLLYDTFVIGSLQVMPQSDCLPAPALRWGWVFLERTRILSGIQFTTYFIESFVVETKRFVGSFVHVILMRQTCSQRSSRAAESKRRAIGNYFSERICYLFLISKCRGDQDPGLCTASVLAFGEPQRNGKIRFFLRQNTFSPRILPSRCGSLNTSTEIVHSLRYQSPLHFDIRNI